MKKILTSALIALVSTLAHATTMVPSSLINWVAPLPIANGGTGATSAVNALTNLGAAPLAGATFTGGSGLNYSSPTFTISDSGGTGQAKVLLRSGTTSVWSVNSISTSSLFRIDRYVSGTFVDSPITIANATGVVTYTAIPVQPTPTTSDSSTNSATTAYVKAQFSGAANNAAFGTISATGLITPSSTSGIKGTATNDSANAGSVGEYVTNTTSGTSLTTATANTCTSVSLTAGDWDVQSVILYTPGSGTSITSLYSGVSTVAGTAGSLGQYTKVGTPGQVPNNTSVITSPVVRVSISSTTTVYAIGRGDFTVSTLTCDGFIRARRVR